MSQAELIRQGQLLQKQQQLLLHKAPARVALRSLVNAGSYALGKNIEDADTDELMVHLEALINHLKEIKRINEEIKALEY